MGRPRSPAGVVDTLDDQDDSCVRQWLRSLRQTDPETYRSVNVAIDMLAETGPGLGRPLADTLHGSSISNLKELRPRSGRDVAIRVLFAFDPWSQARAAGPAGLQRAWWRGSAGRRVARLAS